MSRRSVNVLRNMQGMVFNKAVEHNGPDTFSAAVTHSGAITNSANQTLIGAEIASTVTGTALSGAVGTAREVWWSSATGAASGGLYRIQQEVSLTGISNNTNNAVICQVSKDLPVNGKVVRAAIILTEIGDVAAQNVGLIMGTNDAVAQGTAPAGPVEVIGASVGTGALNADSGGTVGDTEAYAGVGIDVPTGGFLYLVADGTGNTNDGSTNATGKVLVMVEYFGSAAPA